jgi:hypothetical protein
MAWFRGWWKEIQDAEEAEQGERDAVGDRGGGCSV